MRVLKIASLILVLCLVVISSFGCNSESDTANEAESEIVTVERGDIVIDIPASGNLALSHKEELAFEMAGTVEEVLVEESDSVKEGQVLARLDASEWEDHLEQLDDAITTAQRQLTTKERALTTSQRQLATAERQVEAKKRDLLQLKRNLQAAQYNLEAMEKVQEIKDKIENAEWELKFAELMLTEARKAQDADSTKYWREVIAGLIENSSEKEGKLVKLNKDLSELLADPDIRDASITAVTQITLKKMDLDIADEKYKAAEADVGVAETTVDDARIAVSDAEVAVEDARENVKDAQETLDEAKEKSTEVIAPFDGFIIRVNIEGGDEIMKGTVAVILADPTKFEADVMVGEMDILQVKLEGDATVTVDSMPGLTLPAKVAHIAPTATIQQGVVNYKVTVEIESLEAMQEERQEARQKNMEAVSEGQMPDRLKQAIEEGRISKEQAEEIMKRMQEGGMQPGGNQQGAGTGSQQRQMPALNMNDIQLREGLTVTVSILVDQRKNVLLVPNKAIISSGRDKAVNILKDGEIEERSIKTDLSDYQNTEVTEGLSEGEEVVIPQKSTKTQTTQQSGGGGGGMPFMRPPR